jgi:hypothetical protein
MNVKHPLVVAAALLAMLVPAASATATEPMTPPEVTPPKALSLKLRQALKPPPVRRKRSSAPVARTSGWYDYYRVHVDAHCFYGLGGHLLVNTPIIKPLGANNYQWVAFRASYLNTQRVISSDWWYGNAARWGSFVNYGAWQFMNARTGARQSTPDLLFPLLPYQSNVIVNVVWYQGSQLVRRVNIVLNGYDFTNCNGG